MKDDVISHFLNPFFYFSDFFDFSGSARNHNFHFRCEYITKKGRYFKVSKNHEVHFWSVLRHLKGSVLSEKSFIIFESKLIFLGEFPLWYF